MAERPHPMRRGCRARWARPGSRANPGAADETTELDRIVGWLDGRTGLAAFVAGRLRKVFPDHWTFLLGEIALFCFVILVATGTFLTFFYTPDPAQGHLRRDVC